LLLLVQQQDHHPHCFHLQSFLSSVETSITYAKVKKDVLRRAQLQPFGRIRDEEGQRVTGQEKPIEIRCLPPVIVQQQVQDDTQVTDLMLEQIQTVPRCKNCGMEGHTSLKCPKRNEIQVIAPKGIDEYKEITILVTDISDMTTENELNALVTEHRFRINQELSRDPTYSQVRQFKCSMPRDREGGNYRGIAYINIPSTPSADLFAQKLVDSLDGAKLGMVLIHAAIQPDRGSNRGKKGPNRYDDEDKWGSMGGRF